jgi:CubicO group peptidase (beta-lactamase class C family)
MRKHSKNLITIVAVLCFCALFTSCTTTYMGRYVSLGMFGSLEKQLKLPSNPVNNGGNPFYFIEDDEIASRYSGVFTDITYRSNKGEATADFFKLLEENKTVAFMAIKDDKIVLEKYYRGFERESKLTSYSIAKSFTSALVGIAVENGQIESIDDPVNKYLAEFQGDGLDQVTIKNLLEMNSGLKHSFGMGPGKDFIKSAFHPDIRTMALEQEREKDPGEQWWYNNYHTVMLGMILEEVTGKLPSQLLQEQLWIPLGMEYDATWSTDYKTDGSAIMALGINASIIDYAKFARLYLNKGNWEGTQILSKEWVEESTTTDPSGGDTTSYYLSTDDPIGNNFQNLGGYYAYQWWGYNNEDGSREYYAFGIKGQYLYICPEKNLILIRFGENFGDVYWWPEVLRDVAKRF